jgi:hypothetical protein
VLPHRARTVRAALCTNGKALVIVRRQSLG